MEESSPTVEDLLQSGFQYACALAHNHHDAEDLVQIAWLKTYKRYGNNITKALFFTTIRNLYIDQYRRAKRIQFIELKSENEHFSDSGNTDREHAIVAIDQMLGRLRDIEREALFLHIVEGYSTEEIAAITGKPRGTVLSLIHRSKKKLAALDAAK